MPRTAVPSPTASFGGGFRFTAAQLAVGTLIAVAAAVSLLAVSGESGVWRVTVLVAFAVALGTLSAVLLAPAARRRPQRSASDVEPPTAAAGSAPAASREPAYAHRAP